MRRPVFLLAFLFFLPVSVASAWEIQQFDAALTVQSDGSLLVRETIRADFRGESRHGIYRDIPLVTQDRLGRRESVRLIFLRATDEAGQPWEVSLSREGVYQHIRLGSASVTYDDQKTFQLTYRVERILRSFPDHDELYWNVTGNSWAVPIRSVMATVHLPRSVPKEKLLATAYTGAYSSTAKEADITVEGDDTLRYIVSRSLGPYEGLTVVAGWPAGLVAMPSRARRLQWFFLDNWIFGIPLVTLLVMTILWWRYGRDPRRGPITVRYEPPEDLTPAEAGTLVDEKADVRDITATIVDLARRGHLAIEEKSDKEFLFSKRDYLLRRKLPSDAKNAVELKSHELLILNGLFPSGETTHLSDLENEFYSKLPAIRSAAYAELVRKRCWRSRPDQVRQISLWMAGGAGIFLIAAFNGNWGSTTLFSMMASVLIIGAFGRIMPRKTPEGMRMLEQVLGLEEFLRRTDADRLRRETDPGALFERMLPYAMALGVANQWAKAFEGIYQVKPNWYVSGDSNIFSPSDFTSRLNATAARVGSVLASAPRSSGGSGFGGGGFSGGGGGGGGGGAW